MLSEVMLKLMSSSLKLIPLSLLTLSTACTVCNPGGQEPQRFTAGRLSADGTTYETAGVYEPMLAFPSGRRYDIVHGLGQVPATVNSYVSFSPQLDPESEDEGSLSLNNIAESAGNQVVIERWDDEIVRIRNDTCIQEFYVRLVLTAPAGSANQNMGGMSGVEE